MKRYRAPQIKSILLSQEQAVLQVCVIGGGYMSNPTKCMPIGLDAMNCVTSVKKQNTSVGTPVISLAAGS